VSGSFFFSVLNKCSPLARTSAITVCFSLAKLGGSHQQPSRSVAPPASAESKAYSEAQQGVSKKPPGFSSTPHLSVHGAYVPTPHPSIHRREIAGGNWCCST
ncbi:Chromatin-remodeling ATPase INO80, partial [Dissostichus eleginoides]